MKSFRRINTSIKCNRKNNNMIKHDSKTKSYQGSENVYVKKV